MAAGLGSRFGSRTDLIPKGFIEVGGKPMVVRSIETLIACGVKRILIGTGWHKESYEELKEKYPMIETCFSPRYAETNSMYTLWNMRSLIGEDDFLLLESDLVFSREAIESLDACAAETAMLITPVRKFQDQYYVEADSRGILTNCSVKRDEIRASGELVGIHKLSHGFFAQMCADYGAVVDEKPKLGYEYELLHMSQTVAPVYVLNNPEVRWYEIDDTDDLAYAEEHVVPFL